MSPNPVVLNTPAVECRMTFMDYNLISLYKKDFTFLWKLDHAYLLKALTFYA